MEATAIPQPMRALAEANRVRLARGELKKRINRGEETVAGVLEAVPEYARKMTLGELLRAQERWGRVRTRKLLNRCQISEQRLLGNLTRRQCSVIVWELGR